MINKQTENSLEEKVKAIIQTENGLEEQILEVETSEVKTLKVKNETISSLEDWDKHFNIDESDIIDNFNSDKVCIKTTITSVSHPFQTKTEMKTKCVRIPLNGKICTDIPVLYRRNVTYKTFAEVCYPADLVIQNVEKCSKQGAIAATVAAASGNFSAATLAFQTAFLACMIFSDVNDAQKISIRVAGEKEHGDWHPV